MQFVFNNAFTYTKQKIYYQPFISRTWSLIVSRVLVTREDELLVHTCASTCILRVCNVDPDIDLTVYHRLWYVGTYRNLSMLKKKTEFIARNYTLLIHLE